MAGYESKTHEPVDYFGPGFILAFIMAGTSDAFTLGFGLLAMIPLIGPFSLLAGIAAHYFVGFALAFLIFPQLKHFVPKFVLITAVAIPLPWLALGLIIAVISQNKFIEAVLIQAGTKALEVGLALTGAGAPVAGAIEAAAEAKTAEVMAEGGMAAASGARAAGTAGESFGRRALEKGAEKIKESVDERDDKRAEEREAMDEALGERPDVLTQMERDLNPEDIRPGSYAPEVESNDNVVNLKEAA